MIRVFLTAVAFVLVAFVLAIIVGSKPVVDDGCGSQPTPKSSRLCIEIGEPVKIGPK